MERRTSAHQVELLVDRRRITRTGWMTRWVGIAMLGFDAVMAMVGIVGIAQMDIVEGVLILGTAFVLLPFSWSYVKGPTVLFELPLRPSGVVLDSAGIRLPRRRVAWADIRGVDLQADSWHVRVVVFTRDGQCVVIAKACSWKVAHVIASQLRERIPQGVGEDAAARAAIGELAKRAGSAE